MNFQREPDTTDSYRCSDFKAALSAYLDDELARAERFRADAHLLSCAPCRALTERAEAMDAKLRGEFAHDVEDAEAELANEQFDVGAMQARVLAAIGAEHRRTWMPRIAAAAAIAIVALGGVIFWKSRDGSPSLAPVLPPDGGRELAHGESATPRDFNPTVAAPSSRATRLAALNSDDRQALYATSALLDAVRRTAFDDRARRAELSEIARYDELVERLTDVLPKLPAEDRVTVALARDATARIVDSTEAPEAWSEGEWSLLQEDVATRALDRSVDELSDAE